MFWIDVSSVDIAKNDFIALAKILGSAAESIDDARQVLANTPKSWLLVLDNADDPKFDYQGYFPSGNHGTVIMTSRLAECSSYNTVGSEALIGLETEQSRQLLLKAAEIPEESWTSHKEGAEEVVKVLGSHTLALIQAGAYIAKGHCELDRYPQEYNQQRRRLLDYRPKQGQSRYCNVYATFEASATLLSKDALQLLGVLSMLQSGFLPIQIFEDAWWGSRPLLQRPSARSNSKRTGTFRVKSGFKRIWTAFQRGSQGDVGSEDLSLSTYHVSQLPDFIIASHGEWDRHRLMEAISSLASLSLVTQTSQQGSRGLSMHPLAHAWALDRLEPEEKRRAWTTAGCVIALSREGSDIWKSDEQHLRPHIQAYVDARKETLSGALEANMVPLLITCGWILSRMRDDGRLTLLVRTLFDELKADPMKPSERLVILYDLLARSLYWDGNYQVAVRLLEHVVKVRKRTLAATHPQRLASQHGLALAYQANGQVEDAVRLLKHVVEVEQTTLAETHPDRLASQHGLALAYQASGQVEDAVLLLEHVVKVRETTLAATHPQRLASQHKLAGAYLANGQVEDALRLQKAERNTATSTSTSTSSSGRSPSPLQFALPDTESKRNAESSKVSDTATYE